MNTEEKIKLIKSKLIDYTHLPPLYEKGKRYEANSLVTDGHDVYWCLFSTDAEPGNNNEWVLQINGRSLIMHSYLKLALEVIEELEKNQSSSTISCTAPCN